MNSENTLSSEVPETPSCESESEIRRPKLSYKQCCQIQTLQFVAGWTYSQIAEGIELPLSTVFNICIRQITPPRTRGHIKINTPLHKHLVFEATKNVFTRRKSLHKIASSISLHASEDSLHQVFAKEDYHHCHAKIKSFLIKLQKIRCLNFAQSRISWNKHV